MDATKFMLASAFLVAGCATVADDAFHYAIEADSIPRALTDVPGDAARGRAVVAGRDANCLLCHAVPETGERFMGNVGPPLSGVARRLSAGQMRLRIVDPTRVNRDVVMPAYYRVSGLSQVAPEYAGKPVLTAQQVEDVVAYLRTLQ